MITEGIHKMTMREYLALPFLSSGICGKIMSESPYHAKFAVDNSYESTPEMDIGTFAHAMLLEGGTDALVKIDAEDWRTKAAKEARDAAHASGKIPILSKKVAQVELMVKAAREFISGSEIAGVFDSGEPEVTMVFRHGDILCKARADWLTSDRKICLSYKTTAGTANPEAWIRTQLPSYDVATVFYERAVLAVSPDIEETLCVHLVQEQSAPFACSLVALAPALEDLAAKKMDRAVELWAQCQANGTYPAYPSRICYAEPKPWQLSEFEESMNTGGAL